MKNPQALDRGFSFVEEKKAFTNLMSFLFHRFVSFDFAIA